MFYFLGVMEKGISEGEFLLLDNVKECCVFCVSGLIMGINCRCLFFSFCVKK